MKKTAVLEKEHNQSNCTEPGCERCRNKKPFEVPIEILNACKTGDLVIFAGAGISTEGRGVYPTPFYQWVKDELAIPDDETISFPKLMTQYCSKKGGRKALLQAIQKRIDYVKTFPELYRQATEFHRELSTIPHFNEIFTTNWDDFFEVECGATPIVTGQDFAVLQDTSGRKIFKLHGSIYNYGSIVATEADYKKCYRRLSTGIVGAVLKTLIFSKIIVFVGFSFEDDDFRKIYRLLNKDVAGLIPDLFVVTLDENAKDKLRKYGVKATPIITSGAFFVQELKKRLVEEKIMLPDEQFVGIQEKLDEVRFEHSTLSQLNIKDHPDVIYSQWYQDGLQHAFERLLATKKTGQNSCGQHTFSCIEEYEDMIADALHKRHYYDVAYLRGYQSGLIYFLLDKKRKGTLPMYFLFGMDDIVDFQQYMKLEKDASKAHKSAHAAALEIVKQVKSDFHVPHRQPFI